MRNLGLDDVVRIRALSKNWPSREIGPPPPILPAPIVRVIGKVVCQNCGGRARRVEIVTHVPNSTPVVLVECEAC
jgi:hypothetical protein